MTISPFHRSGPGENGETHRETEQEFQYLTHGRQIEIVSLIISQYDII